MSSSVQAFIDQSDLRLSKNLARRVVDQMGGDEYFANKFKDVNRFTAKSGFKGISSIHDILKFFDDNRKELDDYAAAQGELLDMDAAQFISIVISQPNFNVDRVDIGLQEAAIQDIEECSESRMMVASHLIWNVVDIMCDAYANYIRAGCE